jgi:hypothetical protein
MCGSSSCKTARGCAALDGWLIDHCYRRYRYRWTYYLDKPW